MYAERSPCYGCAEKNYIGGCEKGCEKHKKYEAKKADAKLKAKNAKAAKEVLVDGCIRWKKEEHRRR